jgi:hypothetical protein
MKHVGSFSSKLAACGVALLITSIAISASAQDTPGYAKVRAIRGAAQYSEAGGAWMPLAVDMTLRSGAVIKTDANSQVDLFLDKNGPVVRVTADTTLGLDKLFYSDAGGDVVIDTQLNLRNGRILGNVKKMAEASKYDVKVPTGTVGIRGTDYDISATGQVTVTSGSVNVSYITTTGTIQMTVNAGQTFNPPTEAGGQPTVTPTPPEVLAAIKKEIRDAITVVIVTPPPGGEQAIIVVQPAEQPVSPTQGGSPH